MTSGQKSAYEYFSKRHKTITEDDKEKNRQYGIEYYIKNRKSKRPYRPLKKVWYN